MQSCIYSFMKARLLVGPLVSSSATSEAADAQVEEETAATTVETDRELNVEAECCPILGTAAVPLSHDLRAHAESTMTSPDLSRPPPEAEPSHRRPAEALLGLEAPTLPSPPSVPPIPAASRGALVIPRQQSPRVPAPELRKPETRGRAWAAEKIESGCSAADGYDAEGEDGPWAGPPRPHSQEQINTSATCQKSPPLPSSPPRAEIGDDTNSNAAR